MTIYSRILLLILTTLSQQLYATDTCSYSFKFNGASNKLIITFIPPDKTYDFIYQPDTKGFFSEDDKAFTISTIAAYSGAKSIAVKKSDHHIRITSAEKVDSIKYQITINRKSLRDGSPFDISGSDFLITPAIICILPTGDFSSVSINVSSNKFVTTSFPVKSKSDVSTITLLSKTELHTPLIFSNQNEYLYSAENKTFRIMHLSESYDTTICKIIAETIALPDFHKDIFPDDYSFYIHKLPYNQQQFNKTTSQQSHFDKKYCIVNIPESFNNSDLKSYIYNICTEAEVSLLIKNFTLNYSAIHSSPWINEGLRPYLSLQNLCKNGIYTEFDFLAMMTEKIEGSSGMPLFSLADYQSNPFFNKQDQYKAVSNRSILFSWLLDMQIISLTNAQSSLANVLSSVLTNKDLTIASDEDLVQEVVRLSHPDIQLFFDEYYYHPRAFQFKKLLMKGGYIYISNEVTELYKSGPLEIEFDDSNHKILLRKPNTCYRNESGDELIAINGRPVGRSNIHQLFKSYFTRNYSPDEITLTVLRNGQQVQLNCTPVARKEEVSFFIYPDMHAPKLHFISRKIITGN